MMVLLGNLAEIVVADFPVILRELVEAAAADTGAMGCLTIMCPAALHNSYREVLASSAV